MCEEIMEKYEYTLGEEDLGKRIDVFLSENTDLSRSSIKKYMEDGCIKVNDAICKASYKLQQGDKIVASIPDKSIEIEAQNIEIDVLYEDKDLLVVNKPQGMVVHPAPGNYKDTLVNSLLFHIDTLSSINGEMRPGIVHRIDKDTSGLLVVAKSDLAHKSLSIQLKEHTICRKYIALVEGIVEDTMGTVDAPIGRDEKNRKRMAVRDRNSKNAVTHFNVIKRYSKNTLIEAKLETGRTHQIRVHMSFIGHPLVGDNLYGYKRQKLYSKGQLLHASLLGFIHPDTGQYMEFSVKLPKYFEEVLEKLDREEM